MFPRQVNGRWRAEQACGSIVAGTLLRSFLASLCCCICRVYPTLEISDRHHWHCIDHGVPLVDYLLLLGVTPLVSLSTQALLIKFNR